MFHFFIGVEFVHSAEAAPILLIAEVIEVFALDFNEKFRTFDVALKLIQEQIHLIFVVLEPTNEHLFLLVMPLHQIFLHHFLETLVRVSLTRQGFRLDNWKTLSNFLRSSFFPASSWEVVEAMGYSHRYNYFRVYVFKVITNADRHVNPFRSSLQSLNDLFQLFKKCVKFFKCQRYWDKILSFVISDKFFEKVVNVSNRTYLRNLRKLLIIYL